MDLRVIAIAALAVGCKQLQDQECKCGSSTTPSTLSCDSRDLCQGNFTVVGHSDLKARGMNSALALIGHYAYIGSRTDGLTHTDAGVMIVDIQDPTAPVVVGQIGPPDEAVLGLSSREMRAVPDLNLLFVLNINCSVGQHACSKDLNMYPNTGGNAEFENMKVFDTTDPVHPVLLSTFSYNNAPDTVPYVPPHEFFLWRDPNDPQRVIVFVSEYFGPPSLSVVDYTDPRNPVLLTTYDARLETGLDLPRTQTESLHSLTVSDDGRIAYIAHLGTGFFMLDSSQIADKVPNPRLLTLTPIGARVDYSPPYDPNTHSALKVPNRDVVLLTNEVYPIEGDQGCPWGWGWLVDISNPMAPKLFETTDHATGAVTINGQIRLAQNDIDQCPTEALQRRKTYTAHNPTVTENLAIISWYGGGLQAIDIHDAANPVQVGAFFPDPLPSVTTEDPALGGTSTEMWGTPIFRDGYIYVSDVRNGFYILRYTGPYADEVTSYPFREGSSNIK